MDTKDLAQRLWTARCQGGEVELSPVEEALTLETAYRLQGDYVAASDSRLNGWKVGATNSEIQGLLGLTEPFAGPLFERFTCQSPAEFEMPEGRPIVVEAEFVLRLGEDIRDGHESCTAQTLASAVDAVCPGIEVGGSRLASRFDDSTPWLVADAAGNAGLVHGAAVESWRDYDLAGHSAVLIVNGEEIARGTGADVLGHPLESLAWLVKFLSRQGRSLHKGDLITTGTCTGIQYVQLGDEVVVDFGALGEARVKLV